MTSLNNFTGIRILNIIEKYQQNNYYESYKNQIIKVDDIHA